MAVPRSPEDALRAATLRRAFAAALAARLADTAQHDATTLVPAYRLLLDLSTGPDAASSGEGVAATPPQPAPPTDAAGGSTSAAPGIEVGTSGGLRLAAADDAADSGMSPEGEPESAALLVAEVVLKALQSNVGGESTPSRPAGCDEQV